MNFEDILNERGVLYYTNVGDSMMPLIHEGTDILVIRKQEGRLKKFDIPLYKRPNGQYILHRVLKVRDNDYVLCGDNRWARETGITDDNILGVLTGIVREGKEIPLKGMKYRLYVFTRCTLYPVRAAILKMKCKLRR